MPINLNAASIDKHETAQQPRGIAQGHCRCDPAAHRGANDQDIMQVEPFEQVKVGKGEIINTVEPLRARLARKSRVGRQEHVRALGEDFREAKHGLRPATTMQDKNGAATASLIDAYRQAIGERLSSSAK